MNLTIECIAALGRLRKYCHEATIEVVPGSTAAKGLGYIEYRPWFDDLRQPRQKAILWGARPPLAALLYALLQAEDDAARVAIHGLCRQPPRQFATSVTL